MIEISNQLLTATINLKGAELTTLVSKNSGLNYIWRADPNWWGKHSPVLFPVVGSLRNDKYSWQGKEYSLPRHGFARERNFEGIRTGANEAKFILNSDEESLKVFPFQFQLILKYSLVDSGLKVSYTVLNTGGSEMFFCLGAHPAFAVPLEGQLNYTDYFLEF